MVLNVLIFFTILILRIKREEFINLFVIAMVSLKCIKNLNHDFLWTGLIDIFRKVYFYNEYDI